MFVFERTNHRQLNLRVIFAFWAGTFCLSTEGDAAPGSNEWITRLCHQHDWTLASYHVQVCARGYLNAWEHWHGQCCRCSCGRCGPPYYTPLLTSIVCRLSVPCGACARGLCR